MGIRESLNKNPALTTGITIGVITIAIVYILWGAMFGSDSSSNVPSRAFYTVDNGKSWFVDDSRKPVPFRIDGEEAVRVHLYTCDGGKTRTPVYMEKYTEAGLKLYDEVLKAASSKNPSAGIGLEERLAREILIKRPSDSKWYPRPNPGVDAMLAQAACPGNSGTPEEVFPD